MPDRERKRGLPSAALAVLPMLLTSGLIVGRGVPSNYEISVDGEIEMVGADPG